MVMAATLFKLDSPVSDTDKEMITTSKIAVQSQEIPVDCKSINKEKKVSIEKHDSETGDNGGKQLKKKRHKWVSGGDMILNTESSKVGEGSRRHEKYLLLYYKRTGKAWKRGYLLYEVKTDEDKGDETDEETSDTEEEIGVVKVREWTDTVQNDDVKKNDPKKKKKKKSSKKVKLSVEDVKINNPNAVSKFRITDPLREKLQATTFDMVLGGADLVEMAPAVQGKTMVLVLYILKSLINGPAKRKKKNVYGRPPSVLVLLPTRELAKQVFADFDAYEGSVGLTSCCVYGRSQETKLKRDVGIGRIKDHTESGGSKICFTKTKDQPSELSSLLLGARTLHGDIQQSQHKLTLAGFRKGGAGNTGVVVMLYGSRKFGVSRIEKQAGKRFEHVSAPQPNDIARDVGMESDEKITQVCDSVVPAFLMAAGRRKLSESAPLDEEHGGNSAGGGKKSNKVPKRNGTRTTKKKVIAKDEPIEESSQFLVDSDDVSDKESDTKEPVRSRKKASPAAGSSDVEEEKTEKKVRQRTVKRFKKVEDGLVTTSSTYDEVSDAEEALAVEATDADSEGEEIDLSKHESEDISHTYGWPLLVCCFGSTQHVFVPSGRPANRFLDCEFKTVEARIEDFHRKEEELKKELEIVKNQNASDSTVLLLVTRELQKITQELAAAIDAKNMFLSQSEKASKLVSIHAEKVAVLKSELEKARNFEAEVKERELIIENLNGEIEVLEMAKFYAHGSADQRCNKAIEEEKQLDEANMMKRSALAYLVSLTKQFEGSNKRLHNMQYEMTDRKDKVKLMVMVGLRQSHDPEKSENLLETAEKLLSKVEKEARNLKAEIKTDKEEKKQALKRNHILQGKKNKSLSELKRSKKEVMQSLASALHQALSESCELKETLLSLGGHDNETQVEHYKKMVAVARYKIDVLVGEVEQNKMRETGLVNHVNKFDEGFCSMEKEMNRLGNLAKRTKEEADGTLKKESQMRDDLKEVEDELFYLQEILREARAERFKKDAKIMDRKTEFQSILHEIYLLRVKEDDGKNATRHIFYVDESLITQCSSNQETDELSSCEADNMAGMKQIIYHLMSEYVEYDIIVVQRIPESEQRVDTLTKALGRLKIKETRGLVDIEDLSKMKFKLKGENVGLSLKTD